MASSAEDAIDKREELYSRCAIQEPGKLFAQQDLVNLNVTESLSELVKLCQELANAQLFEVLELDGRPCYRLRTREEAQKLLSLSRDEYLVYTRIEGTSTAGIWSQHLKSKTRLHKTVIDRCLKSLENKHYIKRIKSVKAPGRIIYMKHGLNPGEDVTGGAWFTDGELDVDFIRDIGEVVVQHVRIRSWYEMPRIHKERGDTTRRLSGSASQKSGAVASIKPSNDDMEFEIIEQHSEAREWAPIRTSNLQPYPPGYANYPTPQEILDFLEKEGIVQGKDLTLPDLQHLLDVLVFDGKIEKLNSPADRPLDDLMIEGEDMYRWIRHSDSGGSLATGNGFSEAPCSKCPVFSLCEDGGPVSARNCSYFEEWLSM